MAVLLLFLTSFHLWPRRFRRGCHTPCEEPTGVPCGAGHPPGLVHAHPAAPPWSPVAPRSESSSPSLISACGALAIAPARGVCHPRGGCGAAQQATGVHWYRVSSIKYVCRYRRIPIYYQVLLACSKPCCSLRISAANRGVHQSAAAPALGLQAQPAARPRAQQRGPQAGMASETMIRRVVPGRHHGHVGALLVRRPASNACSVLSARLPEGRRAGPGPGWRGACAREMKD